MVMHEKQRTSVRVKTKHAPSNERRTLLRCTIALHMYLYHLSKLENDRQSDAITISLRTSSEEDIDDA